MTQEEMADSLGMNVSNIGHILRGRHKLKAVYRLQVERWLAQHRALGLLSTKATAPCTQEGRTYRDEEYMAHLPYCAGCLAEAARLHRTHHAYMLTMGGV